MTLRVLVVEDEFLIATDLMDLIEEFGHIPVGPADTLESAVRFVGQSKPDICTMDLRLRGGQSGVAVAQEMLQQFGLHSIFVSGNLDANMRPRLVELDPIAFVGKPIAPHLLHQALDLADRSLTEHRSKQKRTEQ
ncbi:response regulator [uncultured Marivita sp.]|uniref:response regulator n=1 Tax=uncultured Marivita sp. TaxID=888080 RepID=UPI002631D0F4|nr:response regulator [uncultured Marivita sp.]